MTDEFSEPKKKTRRLILIIIFLFLCLAGAGGYYLYTLMMRTKVADFKGLTKNDVLAWMSENSVPEEQVVFEREYDDDIEADIVLQQSIAAEEILAKEDVLTVTLSGGPDPEVTYELPDFTGKKRSEIESWFQERHFFTVTISEKPDRTISKDIFLSMNPEAGKTVKRKDTLIVTVSSGYDPSLKDVTLADLSGMSKDEITAWGNANQITMNITDEPSETVAKGEFVSQSVKAGDYLNYGDTVNVVFSAGKPVYIVNQTGKTKEEAAAWISAVDLVPWYAEVYGETDPGIIISQSPSEGVKGEGSTVTFYVSAGYVQIADQTGKTKDTALNYISWLNQEYNSSAKIRYEITEKESDKPAGTVILQHLNGDVQSGTKYCAPGSIVSFTVSKGMPAHVPDYSGWGEQEFLEQVEALGMKVGNRSTAYSSIIGEGHIISNDSGEKPAGSVINYIVSMGPDPGN